MQSLAAAVDRRTPRSPADAFANPPNAAVAGPAPIGGPWRPTRRIAGQGRFLLCRARCDGELGPGCYVLKLLRPKSSAAALLLAGLRREAQVAACIDHPHVISVLAANLADEGPQLVLPYLEGASLERILALSRDRGDRGGLPICFALSIARQIASGLAAMHSAGWLHGQVSPRHILLSPQGQATLIDLTQSRRIGGLETCFKAFASPAHHYAAPELFRPRALTAAVDVYCLGVTLFEALTGQPPFAGLAGQTLATAHATRRPPDLRRLRPDATLEAAELLSRTLAKEPLRRPTAAQLIAWLAELEIAELTRAAN